MPEPLTHLTAETLETYFRAGQPVLLRIAISPDCRLRIDPAAQRLELWVAGNEPEPDVSSLARLDVATESLADGSWTILGADASDAHFEAYSLLAAVVDDLSRGRPFPVAAARAVDTYRGLLERRTRLSEQKAVGLLGELLVLQRLSDESGSAAALESWLGPRAEEHDFALGDIDVEVKTTLSERRVHLIGSDTQLLPTPGRALWLVSVQLTRAGRAKRSFGLPDTIARLRQGVVTGGSRVDSYLGSQGWRDDDAELYPERYLLRSIPAAYLVDERFPAVTRPRIDAVVPNPDLVVQVSYRIDVTSLSHGTPPGALAGFVTEDET